MNSRKLRTLFKEKSSMRLFPTFLIILPLCLSFLTACSGKTVNIEQRNDYDNKQNIISELASGNSIDGQNYVDEFSSDVYVEKSPSFPFDDLRVGDKVLFGHYEKDNDSSNGIEPIEWMVLQVDSDNGKALLLSKYILEFLPYFDKNNDTEELYWNSSYLREWLNGDFYNSAFTVDEQAYILTSSLNNDSSGPLSKTEKGNLKKQGIILDTEDKVFCLSLGEVKLCFDDLEIATYERHDGTAAAQATTYSARKMSWSKNYSTVDDGILFPNPENNNGSWSSDYMTGDDKFDWWLRTRNVDSISINVVCVNRYGLIEVANDYYGAMGVRPAIWVSTESLER